MRPLRSSLGLVRTRRKFQHRPTLNDPILICIAPRRGLIYLETQTVCPSPGFQGPYWGRPPAKVDTIGGLQSWGFSAIYCVVALLAHGITTLVWQRGTSYEFRTSLREHHTRG